MNIIMSVKKEWTDKILNGEKSIELRKNLSLKMNVPFTIYMYETKSSNGCGKIIGQVTCTHISLTDAFISNSEEYAAFAFQQEISNKSCVPIKDIKKYADEKEIVCLFLSNAKRYDIPKLLSDFNFNRPPQSWCKTIK